MVLGSDCEKFQMESCLIVGALRTLSISGCRPNPSAALRLFVAFQTVPFQDPKGASQESVVQGLRVGWSLQAAEAMRLLLLLPRQRLWELCRVLLDYRDQ